MQATVQQVGKKFVLTHNGVRIAKSQYMSYIEEAAQKAGLSIAGVAQEEIVEKTEFSIRERFEFLTQYVDLVSDKVMPSLIITGDGGLGKTYTVMNTLSDKGLTDVADSMGDDDEVSEDGEVRVVGDFAVIKGFSTARALYTTLWEHKNRIVIFDDCDSVLKCPIALNILKGALDSYSDRWISWKSERMLGENVPSMFKFKGQIIFISNMKIGDINQAIRSRSICVDVSMTKNEKIDRMRQIVEENSFMPTYNNDIKNSAIEFIDNHKESANELSIRTLISVTKLAAHGGTNWKRLAEYTLTSQ